MKKLFAVLVAVILVAAMSVPVFAFEGSVDVSLYAGNSANWQTVSSDPVTVNADGTYTVKLSDISIDPETLTVLYLKDVLVEADGEGHPSSDVPADIQILTKSMKINGSEIALDDGYPTGLNGSGAFDVCWYNIWASSYFSTLGMSTITDVEVVFEIVTDGAAAPEADTTPATDAASETPAAAGETTPAPSTAPSTGIAFAVLPAVVALAATVFSKKH